MSVTYREIIAAVQVGFFVPSFALAIFLASRHGFGRSAGWYFLLAFTLLRIVGAICEIIATQNSSVGAYTGAIICNSIGLAPLTLLCLGLLSRANDCSKRQLSPMIFKLISLISLVGLIIGIVGGTKQNHQDGAPLATRVETKVAVIIFLFVYLSTVSIMCILSTRLSGIAPGEKRLLAAVALAVPFLAVRLVYALVADFSHLKSFNILTGSATIYLVMAVIMEMIVTLIVIAFGMTLRKLPKAQADQGELENQSGNSEAQANNEHTPMKSTEKRKAKGPISWLYFAGKDIYNNQQNQKH